MLLRLGSSGGVSLMLNGEAVWSSNTSRTAVPDQDRVPLTLRAGDNVLLFKISTATAAWRFTAELTPAAGGSVDGVAPIPPEAFASRPAFASPPRRVSAAPTSAIQHPAGVDWRLLHADDFAGTQLGPRWRAAVGRREVRDGMVASAVDRAFLAYAEALPAPLRIEYEARGLDAALGHLSAFWLRDPADYGSGLLVGFGSNGNTLNKVLLDGAQIAGARRPLVQPGTWHHAIVQVLANGHAQLIVDGQLALDRAGVPCSQACGPGAPLAPSGTCASTAPSPPK